jgi:hypothetical protein
MPKWAKFGATDRFCPEILVVEVFLLPVPQSSKNSIRCVPEYRLSSIEAERRIQAFEQGEADCHR